MRPKGGNPLTLLYILLAPALAGWMVVHVMHWKVNLLAAIVACYVIEAAISGLFSIGKR